jgi:hypothetical protein
MVENSDIVEGDEILFRDSRLKKNLQRFPGAAAEIGKQTSVKEKTPADDLRDAEDEMPMGNLFEHFAT